MTDNQYIDTMPTLDGKQLAQVILARLGPMPHLKLQKLMYYVDAWHSVFFDRPLVGEEFEAWVHGPVLRSVWQEFRDVSVLNADIPPALVKKDLASECEKRLSADQLELIGDVLEEYGAHTAYHLEQLTHSDQPWLAARGDTPPFAPSEAKISKVQTRDYYASRVGG